MVKRQPSQEGHDHDKDVKRGAEGEEELLQRERVACSSEFYTLLQRQHFNKALYAKFY